MSRRTVSLLLTVVVLLLLGYLARGHLAELWRLRDVPPLLSVAILALFLLARGLGAETIKVGLARLGHEIGRAECFMLSMVASYANLFVPRTGMAPPALYLRHRHDVAYSSYLSLAVATMLIATLEVSMLGLGLHLVLGVQDAKSPRVDLTLLFSLVAFGSSVALLAPVRFFGFAPSRVRELLAQAHLAWVRLASSGATLGRIVALQLGAILLRAIRLQLAFAAAGLEVSFSSALFASLCADLGSLVSLTPAALGFREGAMVFGASWVGLPTGIALLAAIVDRVICTCALLILGQLFVWKGLRGVAPESGRADRG